MNSKIPFINPTFPDSSVIQEDYEHIHANNYYSNNGEFYYAFKQAIESYLGNGVQACVVTNATLGILLALKSRCAPTRKYVVVPSFTFAAGPLAIQWAGFEPIFIDVNEESVQPDIQQMHELYGKHQEDIAAILLCNTFGIGSAEVQEWEMFAAEAQLPLIIDSAAGFGSYYPDGSHVGVKGDCEVFSLHATKPFGIGEGGIIVSRDADFIERMESLKNFGFDSLRSASEYGLNAKISEMSCALGLRILSTLDERLERRREIYRSYCEQVQGYGVGFIPNAERSSLCFASLALPPEWSKHDLMSAYREDRIEVRDYYNPPVHSQNAFARCLHSDLKNTDIYSAQTLSLPISEKLTDSEIDRIMSVIHKYARG